MAGAFLSSKGITLKWNSPAGVVKTVFASLEASTVICQCPLLRSGIEKTADPESDSKISSRFDSKFLLY